MKRQSQVQRNFLRSQAIGVSIASLILASAEDSFFPAGLTPLVALIAHLLVDRYQVIKIPVAVANVLGLTAFVAMAVEFTDNTLIGKLMAGAHLLVYITWVVLLMPKGIRQFWWVAALSVLQIAVASVLTDEIGFGLSLVGMLVVMIWMLTLFTLFRAQIRAAETSRDNSPQIAQDSLNATESEADKSGLVFIENGMQMDADERWVGWRFRGVVASAFLSSLMIAMVTFVVFPRIWVPQSPLAGFTESVRAAFSRTGFSDSVELGDIGEIMQSDARVLQFRITALLNRREIHPDDFTEALGMDELLFRGNAMGRYEKGAWSTGEVDNRPISTYESAANWLKDVASADYRLEVAQDSSAHQFAFAPAPLRNMVMKTENLTVGKRKFSLTTRIKAASGTDAPAQPLEFEAWYSKKPRNQQQHSPQIVVQKGRIEEVLKYFSDPDRLVRDRRRFADRWCITPEIEESLPKLHALAQELCSEDGVLVSKEQRVQRIFHHLNTSGEFSYSLKARVDDFSIDPVEDFLLNRRSGHCEYFASACALLLQAVDVPARVVSGFKGYEENSVNGQYEVKEKHAHSWTEAWLNDRWVTLDPTPAAARNAGVQEARSFAWWHDLKAVMNDNWSNGMKMINPDQQKAMVQPILDSLKQHWKTVKSQGVWTTLKLFVTDFLLKPEKWFSLTTLLGTFFLLLIPALVFRRNPFRWLKRKLTGLGRWASGRQKAEASDVRFYEMFCQVCERYGLALPDHSTAVENADLAAQFFQPSLQAEEDRDLPFRVARAFNAIRFGGTNLPAKHRSELRAEVNRWQERLKAAPKNQRPDNSVA